MTNPIVEQVAERLYELFRAQSGPGPIPWNILPEGRREGWYAQAANLIEPMLAAATEAYSRSGNEILPEHLETETAEIGEKTAGTFAAWRTAWRTSTDDQVQFPNAAVSAGLAANAALRAAFGWAPTPTAPEIVDSMCTFEQQTEAGDELRLHLAAAHGHPVALGAGDSEAHTLHERFHAEGQGLYSHHVRNLQWSHEEIEAAIAVAARHGMSRAEFDRPYAEHLGRTPHTVECDDLRLHLMTYHGVVNAFELRDHQVDDMHTHDHNGPGYGTRNHLSSVQDWSDAKIKRLAADMAHDLEAQKWIRAGYDTTTARLAGRGR
jgi:hypothetical protein